MGRNRGYKGRDYRYQPRVGRSTTSVRYSGRSQNFIQPATTNTSQEYELARSDWRLIDISSSIHPTSGSILYGSTDGTWAWVGELGCKRNLVRYSYDRQNQYVEFSFRPVKGIGNIYMVGIKPKLESFGFKQNAVIMNSTYGLLDALTGIYVNNAAISIWSTSTQYTFTWNAGDKFAVRYYVDGYIKYFRNDVVEYTPPSFNTIGFTSTTYASPYWGNGQEFAMAIYPNTLIPGEPFIYDVRTIGPTNTKIPYQELFALTTGSMQLTGLGNALTGSDAQGLTYASSSAGVSSWNGGAKSSELFDPQYGGDIYYGELPYNYGLTTTDYSMLMGLCDDGADSTMTNWYSNTTFRGGLYNGGNSGKDYNRAYYGTIIINPANSYMLHASASVKIARVISNIETVGWPYSANPDHIASTLFFHPNGTDPNVTEDWHPLTYQIGANANNNATCRAAFHWNIANAGRIDKLTFATSSRS